MPTPKDTWLGGFYFSTGADNQDECSENFSLPDRPLRSGGLPIRHSPNSTGKRYHRFVVFPVILSTLAYFDRGVALTFILVTLPSTVTL